jgi:hypothetical protein
MSEEAIKIAINTLNSASITAEEQALGHFTRRKLKKLTTWNEWEAGEHKQLEIRPILRSKDVWRRY